MCGRLTYQRGLSAWLINDILTNSPCPLRRGGGFRGPPPPPPAKKHMAPSGASRAAASQMTPDKPRIRPAISH